MKNKIWLLLGFLWILNSNCSHKSNDNIRIEGNIKGLGDSKLYIGKIGEYFMNVQPVDSFTCKNDSFNYRRNFRKDDNIYCINDANGQFLYFLPDNEKIIINGNSNNLIRSSIAGSENNALLADYWKSVSLISDQMAPLFSAVGKAKIEHDSLMIKVINKRQDSLLSIIKNLPAKFVTANNNKTAAAVILFLNLSQLRPDGPKIKSLYSKLDKQIQDSPVGIRISDFIKSLESCGIGKPFADFELVDNENKIVPISSLKGKCFLIEFWTTWCGPCSGELPTLLKAYDKYKSKGFEIISISLDNSKQQWLNAVENQKTPWIQTIIKNSASYKSYLAPFESDVAQAYSVLYVPANFLISSDGLIIATDLRGNSLMDKLLEIYKE